MWHNSRWQAFVVLLGLLVTFSMALSALPVVGQDETVADADLGSGAKRLAVVNVHIDSD
jgi:hypothetical protein